LPTIYRCPVNKNADLLQIYASGDLLNDIGCAFDERAKKRRKEAMTEN